MKERKKLIERTIRKLASLTGGKEREIQGRHLYKMGQRLLACEKDRIEQKELLSKASKEKPSKKKKLGILRVNDQGDISILHHRKALDISAP